MLTNIYCYLKETSGLLLVLGCSDKKLISFVNTAHADNANNKSTSGYVFLFRRSPIQWLCKKQSLITPFLTITEYLAYNPVIKEGL